MMHLFRESVSGIVFSIVCNMYTVWHDGQDPKRILLILPFQTQLSGVVSSGATFSPKDDTNQLVIPPASVLGQFSELRSSTT